MTAVATRSNRSQAPDTDDHTARHQRGFVRLASDLGEHSGGFAGDLVPAWVCCDPACGGVELNEHVLAINHLCCHRNTATQRRCKSRTGRYHGPFTARWEPQQATTGTRTNL
jgi:hypothetical protein